MKEFIAHIERMKALKSVYDGGSGQHNILSMLIDETEEALNIADVVFSEERAELPNVEMPDIGTKEFNDLCSKTFGGKPV